MVCIIERNSRVRPAHCRSLPTTLSSKILIYQPNVLVVCMNYFSCTFYTTPIFLSLYLYYFFSLLSLYLLLSIFIYKGHGLGLDVELHLQSSRTFLFRLFPDCAHLRACVGCDVNMIRVLPRPAFCLFMFLSLSLSLPLFLSLISSLYIYI